MEGYREKALKSFKEVKEALAHLDPDAGIRIKGSLSEFCEGGLIFLSKSTEGFTVNICDAVRDEKTGLFGVGKREEWLKFKDLEEVMKFVLKAAQRPLKAYLY
jgi:hypothetical protein